MSSFDRDLHQEKTIILSALMITTQTQQHEPLQPDPGA